MHAQPALASARVGTLQTLYYMPEYIDQDTEDRLMLHIRSSKGKWTQLSGRKLQNHGGTVHQKGLIQAPIASWLQPLMQRMHKETGIFGDAAPNHVLINSYQPGEGIMPHTDGPLYHPGVCILSLGAPAVIRFWRRTDGAAVDASNQKPAASLLLMPRSLLVFADEAYSECLHGILEVELEQLDESVCNLHLCRGVDQAQVQLARGGERVSMTVRRVVKVLKNVLLRL